MYSSGNNPQYPNNPYYDPATSKSPPPLQHPVPQHPIHFGGQHTPSPQPQQPQTYNYNPNHSHHGYPSGAYAPSPANGYSQFNLNDPTTQMGMQFAGNAMAQGTAYVEKKLNGWVDMPALRHYFNVNNKYVLSKLRLLLFPWRHSSWKRSADPPREDVNSPDLYIPVMALVTYVLLCGLAAGRQGSFHPEKLYVSVSTSLAIVFFEIVFTRLGCYFMNTPFDTSMLDLVAYYGYKFVPIIVTDVIKLLAPAKWLLWSVFLYTGLAVGFFLLRSMRHVILPDASAGPSTLNPQRKRRMWFLLTIAALQLVYMFFLV